jgi:hypothetical protein
MEESFIKVCTLFQVWHLESRLLSCGLYGYRPEPKLKVCFWQNRHKSGKTSLFQLYRFLVALKSGFAAQTGCLAVKNLKFFTRGVPANIKYLEYSGYL